MNEDHSIFADPLPNKLSDLIETGLMDLAACAKNPIYKINMRSAWHSAEKHTCQICFAGAVMAQTLKVSPKDTRMPGSFLDSIQAKMKALDSAQAGKIGMALLVLHLYKVPESPEYLPHGLADTFNVTPWSVNPTHFCRDMQAVVIELRKFGL